MAEMDIHEMLEYLPHRYPVLLIDRVLECEPGKRILALKNVSVNEPYFPGHFPHRPVMPGVLILEAMAQAAAILAFRTLGSQARRNYDLLLRRHRQGALQAAGGARRPAAHRSVMLQGSKRGIWKFGCAVQGRRNAGQRSRHHVRDRPPGRHGPVIHPDRHRRSAARASAPGVERRRLLGDRRRRWRSARAPRSARTSSSRAAPASAATTASCSSPPSARAPQDKKYAGEDTAVEIGDRNTIREFVHHQPRHGAGCGRHARRQRQLDHGLRALRARLPDRRPHDLRQQHAQLAGHVQVGDWAILGGEHAGAPVRAHRRAQLHRHGHDPRPGPAALRARRGQHGRRPYGINTRACGGAACPPAAIDALKRAYKTLYRGGARRWTRCGSALRSAGRGLRRGARVARFPRRLEARLRALVPADAASVHIGMVAGEASGDLLAAHLIEA